MKTMGRWLAATCASWALAAAAQEITFYYPVAVGGPITKTIDQMAADFERENPGIKVKPVYAGTYQETIVKAITANKAGTPPTTAILLSTDMFTLIDEDAIVPFNDLAADPADQRWLNSFYPAFMANSQTGGKVWGIPFQRSTIVLYWNKDLFREAGLDPNRAPANWKEMLEHAQKLTRHDASGNVTQWGVQIPSSGFPYWLFQGLTTPNGVELMNSADRDDVDHHGQPHQREEQREVRLWRGDAAGVEAAWLAHGRGQLLRVQESDAGRAEGGAQVRALDDAARARRAMGHGHRLRGGAPRRVADREDDRVRARLSGRGGGARPAAVLGRRALDARQPARDQGVERRHPGRPHRSQDSGAGDEGRASRSGPHPARVQVT